MNPILWTRTRTVNLVRSYTLFKTFLTITIIQAVATIVPLATWRSMPAEPALQILVVIVFYACQIGVFFLLLPATLTLARLPNAIKYMRYRGLYTPEELEHMDYTTTITGKEVIDKSPEYRARGSKHAFFSVKDDTATCPWYAITGMYISPQITSSYILTINKKFKILLNHSEINDLLPELYRLPAPNLKINGFPPECIIVVFIILVLTLWITSTYMAR